MASCPFQFYSEKSGCFFVSGVHKFGTFCPEVRRRTGAFIYALYADETSPAPATPRNHSPVFLPLQMPLPTPAAMAFEAAMPTGRITYCTLQAKSCAKGQAPLETPDNKTGSISHTFPVFDTQPVLLSAAPFRGLRVVPCKLT